MRRRQPSTSATLQLRSWPGPHFMRKVLLVSDDDYMPLDEQIALAIKSGPGSLPYEMWRHLIEDPEAALKSLEGLSSATDAGSVADTYRPLK